MENPCNDAVVIDCRHFVEACWAGFSKRLWGAEESLSVSDGGNALQTTRPALHKRGISTRGAVHGSRGSVAPDAVLGSCFLAEYPPRAVGGFTARRR